MSPELGQLEGSLQCGVVGSHQASWFKPGFSGQLHLPTLDLHPRGLRQLHGVQQLHSCCGSAEDKVMSHQELPQEWGNRLLEGTNWTLCTSGPSRKEQWPLKRLNQLACKCPGVSGRNVCWQWPALNTTVLGAVRLAGVSPFEVLHYCHTTIVIPDAKLQEGETAPPINRKLD